MRCMCVMNIFKAKEPPYTVKVLNQSKNNSQEAKNHLVTFIMECTISKTTLDASHNF